MALLKPLSTVPGEGKHLTPIPSECHRAQPQAACAIKSPAPSYPDGGRGAYDIANWRLTTYFAQVLLGGPSHSSTLWCVIICSLRVSAKSFMLTSFSITLYCSVTSPLAKSQSFHLGSVGPDTAVKSHWLNKGTNKPMGVGDMWKACFPNIETSIWLG